MRCDARMRIMLYMQEVINRGGETLSPFEIEDAIGSLEAVKEVMAFSTSHRYKDRGWACLKH